MNHALIGEIAGALALLQIIPYVVSILRGHTKPERMSYFLWLIVDTMGVASYVAVGAHTTVWVQFAFVFTGGLVFLMSIKYGIGGFSHFDLFCFAVAIAGGVLWFVSDNALMALYFTKFVGFIGYLPTIKKVYFLPQTENTLSWGGAALSSNLNIFALNTTSFPILLPVIDAALLQTFVTLLLLFPRARFTGNPWNPHKIHTFLNHPAFAR
ncbi:MAG TPA: hypothetical protein VF401_03895 [Candidatus Saccharimonadales bacterium]